MEKKLGRLFSHKSETLFSVYLYVHSYAGMASHQIAKFLDKLANDNNILLLHHFIPSAMWRFGVTNTAYEAMG